MSERTRERARDLERDRLRETERERVYFVHLMKLKAVIFDRILPPTCFRVSFFAYLAH